jgi:hypothetical protein
MGVIRNRGITQRLSSAIVLCVLLGCATVQSCAAENLDCPEIGPGWVPELIGDAK